MYKRQSEGFVESRIKEGQNLAQDLIEKLDGMLEHVCFIEERSPQIIDCLLYTSFWEYCDIELPKLPLGRKWKVLVNTEFEHTQDVEMCIRDRS